MENIAIEYFSKQELTCTTIPTIRTVRENSTIFGPIAQWIEHRSSKPSIQVRFLIGSRPAFPGVIGVVNILNFKKIYQK